MKFKKITLLSQVERSALTMTFDQGATVIRAPNGFGKSALLKSLYDTFGAEPHRIDASWRDARVTSAVDFEVDGIDRTIIKGAGAYSVFGPNSLLAFHTTSVSELSSYLAKTFDFHLQMTDRKETVVVPPPSYIFAPFYVDQDKSWSSPWHSFRNLYLPKSAQVLADYHSGLKPNAYYVAQSERDKLSLELKEIEQGRKGLADAIKHLENIETAPIYLKVDQFQDAVSRLLEESIQLQREQSEHKAVLLKLIDERALWVAQIGIAQAALTEFDEMLSEAVGHAVDVECPTCGQHYNNDIRARFNIAADADALMEALQHAQNSRRAIDFNITEGRANIDAVATRSAKIEAILALKNDDLSLSDVIAAEGRNVALKSLSDRLTVTDALVGEYSAKIAQYSTEMKHSLNRKHSKAIREDFSSNIAKFGLALDVRQTTEMLKSITGSKHGRGSEGPRGLAAYYYAFLHTANKFGTSIFCPLVIDAPNQQGQDGKHLPAVISFLCKSRPNGAQLLLAVEEPVGLAPGDATIIEVGVKKNKLLEETQFTTAVGYLRPYIDQITSVE